MATVRELETAIHDVEGFRVRLRYPRGRDVRGDRGGLEPYPFVRAAAWGGTVGEWVARRFRRLYPDFAVEVLDARGRRVPANTYVRTVRRSYLRAA